MDEQDISKLSREELIARLNQMQNRIINLEEENETLKAYIHARM